MNLEEKIISYKKAGLKAARKAHYYSELGDNERFYAYLRIYTHMNNKLNEFYHLRNKETEKEMK